MSLLRPLMAGVLLLAVSSSALGPPNGTVGTLDFRYPNHIVQPLVPCPFEGYFPHPRDNTWFYRCYARYGPTLFWRAYFQCPPCTVFSDALDQCVFWETGTKCLPPPPAPCRKTFEDCQLDFICPTANSNLGFVATIEVCSKTTSKCPGQPDKPLCREGDVFDRTNDQCILGKPNGWPCIHVAPPIPTLPPTTTTPKPITPMTTSPFSTPLYTTTTTALPPLPTTPDPNFVCKQAGDRPSAEGYRTLGCSERQFCDNNGLKLAPITGCQSYLECDRTVPTGVLQIVDRQCPAGQFFFYGDLNQCGGQGQLGLHECHQSTTTTTTTQAPSSTQPQPITTTPTPTGAIFSSNNCRTNHQQMGVLDIEATTYCRRLCGDSAMNLDSYRYCDKFYECSAVQDTDEYTLNLTSCTSRKNPVFDRIDRICTVMKNLCN